MNLHEFKLQLKPYTAIVGFDYGEKRLGVAISDLMRIVATADKTIFRTNFENDIELISKIVREREIGGIVYGLPLQMNGEEGETAAKVKKFAEDVYERMPLPYVFWDERLSSKAMENFLIKEVDMSRAKRKKVLDSSSAAYILQGVLDALQYA
ncbi:MAG: Holliday junction resolvase RuvX [Alphaproteobacteria bacterium]|nr:Holliday junction resolvase RuvX [Alphaproteobacteria bacterium]